jgi:hypothetical protein
LDRREEAIGNARLGLFAAGVVLGVLAWRGSVGTIWIVPVLVGFVGLVVAQGRVAEFRKRAEGRVRYHERGLARLDDQWAGSGTSGERFASEEHPYSGDLDLFGSGSLFERLCQARTASGESTLASWLLQPAPIEVLAARREAVAELRPRLDDREELALLGDDVRSGVAPEALAAWGSASMAREHPAIRWLVGLVAVAAFVAVVGRLAEFWDSWPALALIGVEAMIAWRYAKRVHRAVAEVEERSAELRTLAGLLAWVERGRFEAPRLRHLQEQLFVDGRPASARIARLAGLVRWLEARHNVYFALFGSLLLWKTQFALAIEAWRASEGKSIGRWLGVVGEVEALASLASFGFENPADPFPELVEAGPILEGESLGHPLLPAARCVRNDLALGGDLRVLAISGSNMSGKSTWLRTVGVNVVLAQAGATVRAARMKLSPMAVGGTLRVHDSLRDGRSRFYAEVLRLKQLVEMAGQSPPLLFLIDEILHGTNSHDRLQGARAVIEGLIDRGAIGLFTTHDLALAEVAEKLAPRARNVHFADHLGPDGRLAFDYRMRPGIVRQSNALALMRAVGLDV